MLRLWNSETDRSVVAFGVSLCTHSAQGPSISRHVPGGMAQLLATGIRAAAISIAVGATQELDGSRRLRFDEMQTWEIGCDGEASLILRFARYFESLTAPFAIVCPGQPSTTAVLRAMIFKTSVPARCFMEATGSHRAGQCLNLADLPGVYGSGPPLLAEHVAQLVGFDADPHGHVAVSEAEALATFLAGVRLLTCYGELPPAEASRTADSVVNYLCSHQDGLPHRSAFLETAVGWA